MIKIRKPLVVTVAIVLAAIVVSSGFLVADLQAERVSDIYVGVTYCGNTVSDAKLLIDKVKGYTNLFVLQSGLLERDFDSVNEIGDYAISAGMYFLPYFGNCVQSTFLSWLDQAKQRWGTHLLGIYLWR